MVCFHRRVISRRIRGRASDSRATFPLQLREAARVFARSSHEKRRRDIKLLSRRKSQSSSDRGAGKTHQSSRYFRSVNPTETATSLRAILLTVKNENSTLTISLIQTRRRRTFFARGEMIDRMESRARVPAAARTRSAGSIYKLSEHSRRSRECSESAR